LKAKLINAVNSISFVILISHFDEKQVTNINIISCKSPITRRETL
jgi:hypothetical protein